MNWGGVTGRVGIGERGLETIKHIVLMCEILLKGKSQKNNKCQSQSGTFLSRNW